MSISTCQEMTPRTNELSENIQPGVFLAVLAVLIAYTLGGIDVPPNTRTCTHARRVFHQSHMKSYARQENLSSPSRSVTQVRETTSTLSGRTTMCLSFCTAMDGLTPKTGSVVVQRVRPEHLEVCTSFATEGIIVGRVSSHRTKITCRAVQLGVGRKI